MYIGVNILSDNIIMHIILLKTHELKFKIVHQQLSKQPNTIILFQNLISSNLNIYFTMIKKLIFCICILI